MTHKLGNQVEIVRGKYAAALYDHYQGRVQRIPLAVAQLLEQPALGRLSDEDVSSPFFQGLLSRGYLEHVEEYPGETYRADWTLPMFPPLRTLSFEVGARVEPEALDYLIRLVEEATTCFGLLSVVIVVEGEPPSLPGLADRLLALDPQLMLEFLCSDVAWQTLRAPDAGETRLIRIEATPAITAPAYKHLDGLRKAACDAAPVSPSLFIGGYDYFHLLSRRGESDGCLHVDAQLRAFPDICEREYVLADLRREPGTVADLIRSPRTQRYWSASKEGREKCCDCEFRYACPNPIAYRSRAEDIMSAPRNCNYRPETGAWENPA